MWWSVARQEGLGASGLCLASVRCISRLRDRAAELLRHHYTAAPTAPTAAAPAAAAAAAAVTAPAAAAAAAAVFELGEAHLNLAPPLLHGEQQPVGVLRLRAPARRVKLQLPLH